MSEEQIFFYHFEGRDGASGAASALGDSGNPSISEGYGYIANNQRIEGLESKLAATVTLEGGMAPVRDIDREIKQSLKESDEADLERASEYLGAARSLDQENLRHVLETPTNGYQTADRLGRGPYADRNLQSSVRKGLIGGRKVELDNPQTETDNNPEIRFLRNNYAEETINGLEDLMIDQI